MANLGVVLSEAVEEQLSTIGAQAPQVLRRLGGLARSSVDAPYSRDPGGGPSLPSPGSLLYRKPRPAASCFAALRLGAGRPSIVALRRVAAARSLLLRTAAPRGVPFRRRPVPVWYVAVLQPCAGKVCRIPSPAAARRRCPGLSAWVISAPDRRFERCSRSSVNVGAHSAKSMVHALPGGCRSVNFLRQHPQAARSATVGGCAPNLLEMRLPSAAIASTRGSGVRMPGRWTIMPQLFCNRPWERPRSV